MRIAVFAAALLATALPCSAQQTVSGTLTQVRTGWNDDAFGIMLNVPQVNPAHCSEGAQGYISTINNAGYHTYYSAALTAYVARKPVTVTVHNTDCLGGFPKIIGISMP